MNAGAAAEICFGLLAPVTKSFVAELSRGSESAFTSWQPYVLAVLGLGGFLVAQSAYQAGPIAISLPVIDAVEPTVAVILAATVLGEQVRAGTLALGAEALGAMIALAGVFVLGRSPFVLDLYRDARAGRRPAGASRRAAQPGAVAGKTS
jgi:hypothetical protein